jgi:adenosylhomocysteine nucleosidase
MSDLNTNPRPSIAIIAALEREVRPLIKTWSRRDQTYDGRTYRFFEYTGAVAVAAGIGPEAARRAAQAAIALYAPQQIYSAGFAGAACNELKVGDILIPRSVISANDSSSIDISQGEGILVTFSSVATPAQKAKLAASFNAQAIDMEAAAVARAAEARGIRFAAVKSISDAADFAFPPMEKFIDPAGQFRTRKLAIYFLLRPWLWGTAIRLARNSAQASRALSAWLERMIQSHLIQSAPQTTSLEASIQR